MGSLSPRDRMGRGIQWGQVFWGTFRRASSSWMPPLQRDGHATNDVPYGTWSVAKDQGNLWGQAFAMTRATTGDRPSRTAISAPRPPADVDLTLTKCLTPSSLPCGTRSGSSAIRSFPVNNGLDPIRFMDWGFRYLELIVGTASTGVLFLQYATGQRVAQVAKCRILGAFRQARPFGGCQFAFEAHTVVFCIL